MKTLCVTIMIVAFLLLCSNGMHAQTTPTKLNQVELIKQFKGNWKCEVGKDTTGVMEVKSFGEGLELYWKTETKAKILTEVKAIMGYDKTNDKIIESQIMRSSPNIILTVFWFTSPSKCEEVLLEAISNPEQSISKWTYEFKSPDTLVNTYFENKKMTWSYTFHREKK
jgi:hypothetical protein